MKISATRGIALPDMLWVHRLLPPSGLLSAILFLLGCQLGWADPLFSHLRTFSQAKQTSGFMPLAGLVADPNGMLYGTTYTGGVHGGGTLFRLGPDGNNFTTLHSFSATTNDGGAPRTRLVLATDGTLFGTTYGGGSALGGTIFSMHRDGSNYRTLISFGSVALPLALPGELLLGSDGLLYTVAMAGGERGGGLLLRCDRSGGNLTILHAFGASDGDGVLPLPELVETRDGSVFGGTVFGGSVGHGTIFMFRPSDGYYETAYSFTNEGGPSSTPIDGEDGRLYGFTGSGTLYSFDREGASFRPLRALRDEEGVGYGFNALLIGIDGRLYFTTEGGGATVWGSVTAIERDGSGLEVLHRFKNDVEDGGPPPAVWLGEPTAAFLGPRKAEVRPMAARCSRSIPPDANTPNSLPSRNWTCLAPNHKVGCS